jgi:hypothetical protein
MMAENFENMLRTIALQYKKENAIELLKVIVNSKYYIEEDTSYDNWNGGMNGHTIHFTLSEEDYLGIIDDREEYQNKIRADLSKYNISSNEYITTVLLELAEETEYLADWRERTGILAKKKPVEVHNEDKERIWNVGGIRVFISHKVEYKKEASLLKESLSTFGISCFVAHEDIEPTRQWQDEIEKALFSMDSLVALLTKDFHDSRWTDQEVGFALGRQVPIIPIRLGLDPYGFIGKIQGINGNQNVKFEIVSSIIKNKYTKDKMIESYIVAMSRSNAFSKSEELAEIMQILPELDIEQESRLISAYNGNSQIYKCWAFNGEKTGKNPIIELLNRKKNGKYCIQGKEIVLAT